MGEHYNEIWKYDMTFFWKQCPDLRIPRKFHISVIVGFRLFSCGGLTGSAFDSVSDQVECIDTRSIRCDTYKSIPCSGKLARAVRSAAGVAHGNVIYLVGGRRGSDPTDSVVQSIQAYNTETCQGYIFAEDTNLLSEFVVPLACEDQILILGEKDSFSVDTRDPESKVQGEYKTSIRRFAALVEDGSIFVFAQSNASLDRGTIVQYQLTDVRNRFPNPIPDAPTKWETQGTMPFYSNVLVYGITSLPTP